MVMSSFPGNQVFFNLDLIRSTWRFVNRSIRDHRFNDESSAGNVGQCANAGSLRSSGMCAGFGRSSSGHTPFTAGMAQWLGLGATLSHETRSR